MAILFFPNDIVEKLYNGEMTFKEAIDGDHLMQPPDFPEKDLVQDLSSGYIYILKCGDYHKIGRTKHLKNRMSQHRRKVNIKIVFKKKVSNAAVLEKQLLEMFPQEKVGGTEWFSLTPQQVALILKRITKSI